MQCSEGTVPTPFQATPRTTFVMGLMVANELDKAPIVNIPSFVICKKLTQMAGGTPTPCMPAPLLWEDTYPAIMAGGESLLKRSCIRCAAGQGKIEFITSGQIPLPPEVQTELQNAQAEAQETLAEAEKEKNAVGEAGLLEGMIPIWGSGRDLIHSIQTGNGAGIALNAAFLVWDVASIAVGVVSFGTGTAAMMAGKAGVRTALRAAGTVAKQGLKREVAQLAARGLALKTLAREGIQNLAGLGKKCVEACFPAGTLVAAEHGLVPIETIQIGQRVWSQNAASGEVGLQTVTATKTALIDSLWGLQTAQETILSSASHPFWASGEWKFASAVQVDDWLLTRQGERQPVLAVSSHQERGVKVFNFEVSEWGTYFVGRAGWLVHNACNILDEIYKLLGKKNLTPQAAELLEVVKKFDNQVYHSNGHALMLDKQGLTHILGRHHPSYKLDDKAATMFPASSTVDDITGTIGQIINRNPTKMKEILEQQRGHGQIQETIDGVRYQLGFKGNGKIGQFHILGD